MMTSKSEQIRTLNDRLRQNLWAGGETAVITIGVAALGDEAVARIVKTIAVYDDFCHDNDPWEEHDFGALEAEGHTIFFKIDYYDPTLFRAPIREAIQLILGRCPAGIHRLLRRLPSAVFNPDGYQSLVELLDDARSAKLLYHLDERELTDSTFRVLRQIPPALRPMLTAIVQHVFLLDELPAGLQWLAARIGTPNFDVLVGDLAAQRQPAQLIARVTKLVSELPLPDGLPPRTIGKSTRIDTTKGIYDLAKQFRNCLASYTDQVDEGTSIIYLWDEPGLQVVCHVARHGRLGWALDDALGPGNAELDADDRLRVTNAFDQVGIPQASLFQAIESIMQASVAKAERRLIRREREQEDEIYPV